MQITADPEDISGTELSFAEELLLHAEVGGLRAVPFFDCTRNLSLVVQIQGTLNREALRTSLDVIIERHDVLRSRFVICNGRPARLKAQLAATDFPIIDLWRLSPKHPCEIVTNIITPQLERPFDLACGPLLRAFLVALTSNDHILAIAVHHIVFDRWSKRLLKLELSQCYNACATGRATDLKPLLNRYHDYVVWQRRHVTSERGRKLSAYWASQLTNLPNLMLTPDHKGRHVTTTESGTSSFTIPVEDVTRLVFLSRQFRTTLATTMLTIFKLFLHRLTDADDIAVGVPLSDRRRPEFEQLIGLFMNVVVVRTSIASTMTFLDLLDRVRRGLVNACLHQDLPYGYLLRTTGTRPPYRVIFNFLPNLPALDFDLIGLRTEPLGTQIQPESLADISLQVSSDSGTLMCRLVYKAELFSQKCGSTFARHLRLLANAVLTGPQSRIDTYVIG